MAAVSEKYGTAEYNAKHRAWRHKRADILNAQARARYVKNGDKLRARAKLRREKNREAILARARAWRAGHPDAARQYHLKNPAKTMLRCARKRAVRSGLPFNITIDDVVIPELCPVLGIPLRTGFGMGFRDHSPTLDRIDNPRGYVKGNVRVISWRANRLKADSTIEELRKIIAYMELVS